MGIMGSAFGRALGGFGAGVATLANKYIDEDLAKQRAQAMADIQVATAGKIREQDDAFRNDPTRLARDRGAKRDDALAAGATAREVELAALNDTTLQGTRQQVQGKNNEFARGEKVKDIEAVTPFEVAAERSKATAREEVQTQAMKDRLPLEVQRAAAVADAQARASARYRERPPSPSDKLADIERVLGRPLQEPEKLALLGLAKGGGKDPELDTQTVVEKSIGPDGKETTTTRKEVRRPGQGGGSGQDPLLADMEAARKRSGAATKAPAAPAAPPSRGDQLRAQYKQELDALEQMKSGTQTPTRNRRMVPEQEQLLRDLLQQINSL